MVTRFGDELGKLSYCATRSRYFAQAVLPKPSSLDTKSANAEHSIAVREGLPIGPKWKVP